MSTFADEMTAAFAQYSITFLDAPPLGSNHRVHGATADDLTAVEIVVTPQSRIVSGALVGVMADHYSIQRNANITQHLLMALIPGWQEGPTLLAEILNVLRVGGAFTTQQYGMRLKLSYHVPKHMLTMKVEVV